MQQREKILAAVAGLLIVYLAGQYLFGFDPFAAKNKELSNLQKKVEAEQEKAIKAKHAARKVEGWQREALSNNVARSRSDYHYWLLGLVERAKLDNAQVQPERKVIVNRATPDRRNVLAFEKLPFTINGEGSLNQLTEMLHEFYSVDVLHRVRSLSMQPTKSTKTLKLTLVVEALVLPGTVDYEQQIEPILKARCYRCHGPDSSNRKAGLRLDQIAAAMAPLPKSKKTPIVPFRTLDSELVRRIRAGDKERMPPAPDQMLSKPEIELIADWVEQGARVGLPTELPKSHRLALASLGDYQKLIKDRDLFSPYTPPPPPPRKVVERPPQKAPPPPPPPPRFDDSAYAYVTAILEVDERPQIWLYVRTTGKLLKLHEGDPVKVGRFDGKVKRIGRRSVEIQNGNKVSLIGLGENLRADDGE